MQRFAFSTAFPKRSLFSRPHLQIQRCQIVAGKLGVLHACQTRNCFVCGMVSILSTIVIYGWIWFGRTGLCSRTCWRPQPWSLLAMWFFKAGYPRLWRLFATIGPLMRTPLSLVVKMTWALMTTQCWLQWGLAWVCIMLSQLLFPSCEVRLRSARDCGSWSSSAEVLSFEGADCAGSSMFPNDFNVSLILWLGCWGKPKGSRGGLGPSPALVFLYRYILLFCGKPPLRGCCL